MKKRYWNSGTRLAIVIVLLMLIVAGCGSGKPSGESAAGGGRNAGGGSSVGGSRADGAAVAPSAPPIMDMDRGGHFDAIDPAMPAASPRSQAIILNARLTLEVGTELEATLDGIQALADRYGGFVAESRHSGQEPGYREGYAVLRVPSQHFHAVLADLGELGTITGRHTYTEDVGDQLVDLEVRRQSAEEREQRLRELIAQATEITDLIALESELARVRTEIEMIAAQTKRLEDLVAFSTFTITLQEVAPGQEPARPVTLGERIALAFERGLSNAGSFASGLLVFLIAALPVLIVIAAIAAPIWWGVRSLRRAARRRREEKAGAQNPPPPPPESGGSA